MSKLPMESRPLRLAPEIAQVVEARLQPLEGKNLKAAQEAVLKVYQSGQQMAGDQWVQTYEKAIDKATDRP